MLMAGECSHVYICKTSDWKMRDLSRNFIKSAFDILFFSAVYTVLVVIRTIISPVTGIGLSYFSVGSSFLGGLVFAYFLAWMVSNMELRKLELALTLWLTLFIIQYLSNTIEAYFFTTAYSSTLTILLSLLVASVSTFVESMTAVFLFYKERNETRLLTVLSDFFKRRRPSSWIWRIAFASLAYLPIYFLFGMMISPFIIPYYSGSTVLKIPSFTVILPLEFLRGFIYTVVLVPIISSVKISRRTLFVILASFLYIPGAFLNLIVPGSLPTGIIPFHLLEILGDSIVYGYVLARLLGRPR